MLPAPWAPIGFPRRSARGSRQPFRARCPGSGSVPSRLRQNGAPRRSSATKEMSSRMASAQFYRQPLRCTPSIEQPAQILHAGRGGAEVLRQTGWHRGRRHPSGRIVRTLQAACRPNVVAGWLQRAPWSSRAPRRFCGPSDRQRQEVGTGRS